MTRQKAFITLFFKWWNIHLNVCPSIWIFYKRTIRAKHLICMTFALIYHTCILQIIKLSIFTEEAILNEDRTTEEERRYVFILFLFHHTSRKKYLKDVVLVWGGVRGVDILSHPIVWEILRTDKKQTDMASFIL